MSESQRRALELFDAVVDLDPGAREAHLAGHDDETVALVRRWLEADASRDARVTPGHYAGLARTTTVNADASAGERIGAWLLKREIGRGGMGSVWLAERADGDFAQQVALKLMRPDLAAGDAPSRFRRERRIMAALTHPNIAQLLDGGVTDDGRPWLAMEWVDGDTLRALLAHGPLEPAKLLTLATELAVALAHAHGAGVVHRDLKPENVMLARGGYAKILDFGIAKLVAHDSDPGGVDGTQTQPGHVIGTTPYMSPEQASGAAIDFRSDQFSLGALLYEAATGRAAFARQTPSDTVAAVLRDTPRDIDTLADKLPPVFVRVLRRCLAKDPAQRYASTADLARDLAEIDPDSRPLRVRRFVAPLAIAGLAVSAFALGAWWRAREALPAATAPSRQVELALAPAERIAFADFPEHAFALSSDGRQLVYAGVADGARQLFLRDLSKRGAIALPNTDAPTNPAFSPDGQWILFFSGGFELRKVPVRGGTSIMVAHAPYHLGGAMWYDAQTIIFSPQPAAGLWQVSANGGTPKQITFPDYDAGETSHVWPARVPGSTLILYVAEVEAADTFDAGRIYAFDPATGQRTLLVDGGTDPQVIDDTLHYARAGTIYSVGLDVKRVALRGSPTPLYEGVMYTPATGAAQYARASGESVRALGKEGWDVIDPVVIDRAGKAEPLGLPPRNYDRFELSRDARRAVVQVTAADDDLWIYDLERKTFTRLTNRDENIFPTWSPDGQYIYYSHHREHPPSVWRRRADGIGDAEEITTGSSRAQLATGMTPDGRYLLFDQHREDGDVDIGMVEIATRKVSTWLSTPSKEHGARVSPDGRFVSYRSNQSGRDEVYVQAFEGTRRWQISNNGGTEARWCGKGGEIYYLDAGMLYSVKLGAGDDLAPGVPAPLFNGEYGGPYEPFPDCSRFLMSKRVHDPGTAGPLLIDFG